ncbi:MAG: Flp family type IVb pilin [bacterium]|nr:Flp family type IVb pilin [bacterium]
MEMLKRLMVEEEGQTMTEYALLIALIALGLVTVLTTFRGALEGVFTKMGGTVNDVSTEIQAP